MAEHPVASWNGVARDLIARKNLDVVDSARLLAMQNLSGADASINCWNDKYHWDFWRPEGAIKRAAEDGNPATEPDPNWAQLISSPYPEYTSGHNCLDGAHLSVLRTAFGDAPEGGYQITSVSTFLTPGDAPTRTFSSFSQALAELIEARIWAGLHYRFADVDGQLLGRSIAEYMVANYFQVTPLPAAAPAAQAPTQLPRTGSPPLAPLLPLALGLTAAGLLLRRPRR